MIEMEATEYGSRIYNAALIVTDLYSQFVFGRAVTEAPDISLIMRHLMDLFGSFGPPGCFIYFSKFIFVCVYLFVCLRFLSIYFFFIL